MDLLSSQLLRCHRVLLVKMRICSHLNDSAVIRFCWWKYGFVLISMIPRSQGSLSCNLAISLLASFQPVVFVLCGIEGMKLDVPLSGECSAPAVRAR